MAELNLKQIIDRLNAEFTGETRKLVFWYDDKAEFAEDMETVELQNAKIYHLQPDNQFYTKYFLERGYEVDAIDGSKELCALASEYTGIPVKCQLFQELDETRKYDGIWACSSLLHLSLGELDEVLYRIEKALKPQGILYMSFKYGVFEGERNGRYFLDFTEEKLEQLLKKHTSLQQLRNFLTEDVRPDREERWLNLFLKKINS